MCTKECIDVLLLNCSPPFRSSSAVNSFLSQDSCTVCFLEFASFLCFSSSHIRPLYLATEMASSVIFPSSTLIFKIFFGMFISQEILQLL